MARKKRSNLDNILYVYVADDVSDWLNRAAYFHRMPKSKLVDGLIRKAMEKDTENYPPVEKLETKGIKDAGIAEHT